MGDLPVGVYTLSFEYEGEQFEFKLENTLATDYEDLLFYEPMQAAKPVVYLYPEHTTDIAVTLGFPEGGHVTESIPEYGDGWHVSVTPDGTIDGTWPYLFYEAALPPLISLEQGWVLDGGDLDSELSNLLLDLGFAGREIDDFVDYWVPELQGWPWYAVYPQAPDALVTLSIAPQPDHVLRASLVIRGLLEPITLTAPPAAESFHRDGFVATEWGVLVLR
jgi:hypothetical protein